MYLCVLGRKKKKEKIKPTKFRIPEEQGSEETLKVKKKYVQ